MANPIVEDSSEVPETLTVLQKIAQGSQAAVPECIARHGGLIWALARRWSVNHQEAEDLVQEIFIDLWSSAKRYDPKLASEATFISMIARRRMIDRKRKTDREPRALPLPELLSDASTSAFVNVDDRDEAEKARQALDELSNDQRQVLHLASDFGLTYEEIAKETELPLGTVKTHARRGLIRLREKLGLPTNSPAKTSPPREPIL